MLNGTAPTQVPDGASVSVLHAPSPTTASTNRGEKRITCYVGDPVNLSPTRRPCKALCGARPISSKTLDAAGRPQRAMAV